MILFFIVRAIPDKYRSEAAILVEPQKVSEDNVKPFVKVPVKNRLATLEQQVLSRARLEKIITVHNLYPEIRRKGTLADAVEAMRDDIKSKFIRDDAFSIAYVSRTAQTAQQVCSRLASLFIEENPKAQEGYGEGANQPLDSQLRETEQKLLGQEKQLRQFKAKFMEALPQQEQGNSVTLKRLQTQNESIQNSLNRNQMQKASMEKLLKDYDKANAANKTLQGGSQAKIISQDPLLRELETKKEELNSYLLRYTQDHPNVRRLRAEINELEKKVAGRPPVTTSGESSRNTAGNTPTMVKDQKVVQLSQQIDDLERQIQGQKRQLQQIQNDIRLNQSRVESAPHLEQMITKLSREYEISKQQYQSLLANKKGSQWVANSSETQKKGEQFRILDAANLPEKPHSPNRLLLNLAGLAFGFIAGLGLALFVESKDQLIGDEKELYALTGIPVLASIPLIAEGASSQLDQARKVSASRRS
jgi:polysaccharide chain length determinant protein (PEP-CTERM system associated)